MNVPVKLPPEIVQTVPVAGTGGRVDSKQVVEVV
jgi:hypothetical protein